MYPAAIAFKDELGKLNLPLLLHLSYEVEQPAVLRLRACNDIRCTAQQVVTVLCATHELIQLLTAVSATDYYRLTPRLAYRVEKLLY